jgi:hypothetical protein
MKDQNPKWKFEITELPNGGFTIASYKGRRDYEAPIIIAATSSIDFPQTLVRCMSAERNAKDKP